MDPIEQFWQKFEETQDLLGRVPTVFPIKRDRAALKARHERGDPNVVVYCDEDGNPEDYKLVFTKAQREELQRAYRAIKPAFHEHDLMDRHFVGMLETWGDAFADFAAIVVPDQKVRTRAIDSLANALEKVDSALAGMDSAALGWLYACTVDDLATDGVQVSAADDRVTSMRNEWLRSQVEAGELRLSLRQMIATIVAAAAKAAQTLPLAERTKNDPRLKTVMALERLVIENGLAFDTNETGFPALCLRSMFELGGVATEKVGYWLEKAADDPDSYARFIGKMRNKWRGENPPPK